ncbi:hypothetical protein Tcan_18478 [Toxocara canis]|uniref:Uncharacterized protein n=1 Tax=Toxocara canis TaxID=6265 RepID=A0A0B2V4K6_TOXCA|nr:hypothetical protein Tcan_18478 [Toxocara canis]
MCNLNAVIVIVRSKTLNIACYKYLRDQIQNAIVKMRHLFTIPLNFALLMSANGSFITTVLCIGACNAGAMACYAGMGAVFGTVTAGVFIVSLRTCGVVTLLKLTSPEFVGPGRIAYSGLLASLRT